MGEKREGIKSNLHKGCVQPWGKVLLGKELFFSKREILCLFLFGEWALVHHSWAQSELGGCLEISNQHKMRQHIQWELGNVLFVFV